MAKISEKSLELIKTQIANAIERSEANDTIVSIEIDGDSGDALAAINALTDCETDYAMHDREGVDFLDVWGIDEDEDAEDGDMLWRLNISLSGKLNL
jgi:hypothetical protein